MPSLAFRKASICSRFSFSASCTLVVNPQHATRSRLILCWKLPPPSGSSCIGKDWLLTSYGELTYSVLKSNKRPFYVYGDLPYSSQWQREYRSGGVWAHQLRSIRIEEGACVRVQTRVSKCVCLRNRRGSSFAPLRSEA